jgi:hypothetical protein
MRGIDTENGNRVKITPRIKVIKLFRASRTSVNMTSVYDLSARQVSPAFQINTPHPIAAVLISYAVSQNDSKYHDFMHVFNTYMHLIQFGKYTVGCGSLFTYLKQNDGLTNFMSV